MKNEGKERIEGVKNGSVGEQLDALNAKLHGKRNAGDSIRKSMEGAIEAKAKRRCSKEVAASAGWKKG